MVSTDTFLQDSALLIKKVITDNITDPISNSRPFDSKFVMTSYPARKAIYPLITIRIDGVPAMLKMGMRSELRYTTVPIEVRVWARNEKERDILTQNIINILRTNEFGTGSTSDTNELHDFNLVSSVPVDETGIEGIKSMVMTFNYFFVLGS